MSFLNNNNHENAEIECGRKFDLHTFPKKQGMPYLHLPHVSLDFGNRFVIDAIDLVRGIS